MYKEKLKDYESPTVDLLKIKFEGMICQSKNWGDSNEPGGGLGEDPNYTFDF